MPDIRVELGLDPDRVTTLESWGFETALGGWRSDGPIMFGGSVALSTAHAHTGTRSMRMQQDSQWATATTNPIPVDAGRPYRMTVWLRPDAAGSTGVGVLWLRDDDILVETGLTTPVLTAGVWNRVVVDGVAHPRAVSVMLAITYLTGDTSFLYVDDVEWSQVSPGWVDITGDVPAQPIGINRGRSDEAAQAQPTQVRIRLDNADGTWTPGNATSPYFGLLRQGLPLRIAVGHGGVWHVRMEGRVDEWAPTWPYGDLSVGDYLGESVVDVIASGPLRRLGQGDPTEASPITRTINALGFGSYWPLEDGAGSTQAASPTPGVPPITVTGPIEWAEQDDLPGSAPLPILGATTRLVANPITQAPGQWRIDMMIRIPAAPTTHTTLWEVATTGSLRWRISMSTVPALDVQAWDADETLIVNEQVTITQAATGRDFFDTWVYLYLVSTDTASGLSWTCRWGNLLDTSFWGYTANVAGRSSGSLTRIVIPSGWGGTALGHLHTSGVNASILQSLVVDGPDYRDQRAGPAIARLLGEDDVAGRIIGDATATERVGAQPISDLLPLLQRAADVDGGILSEIRDSYGIEYRTRASLYNQVPALVLDGHADNDRAGLQNPFTPILDDQRLRNHLTVKRDGGSSATVADPASIAASGRYADETTIAAANDGQLLPIAGWRLHLGTWPGMRYPSLSLDLTLGSGLVDAWLGMDLGDLIRVTGLPPQHPAGVVDLLMEGYSETITPHRWTATINASPGGPWTVGQLPTPKAVTEGFETAEQAVTITGGGDLPWTRTTTQAHTGAWSLRSGAIDHNQTSSAVITVPPGATSLTLWVRISSEAGWDMFYLYIDAALHTEGSGEVDWTLVTVPVAGASTVTLQYEKDGGVHDGDDAVWVDDLAFTLPGLEISPDQPVRADTAGCELTDPVAADETWLTVETMSGPPWINAATHPTDFPFDVRLGGEVVRVTDVLGTGALQVLVATRSINQITKNHPAGTRVSLAHPAVVAL